MDGNLQLWNRKYSLTLSFPGPGFEKPSPSNYKSGWLRSQANAILVMLARKHTGRVWLNFYDLAKSAVLSSCTGLQEPIQKTKQNATANQWLNNGYSLVNRYIRTEPFFLSRSHVNYRFLLTFPQLQSFGFLTWCRLRRSLNMWSIRPRLPSYH